MGVVVDAERGERRVLEWAVALFLTATSVLFLALTFWLVQALIVYRACGFVFWLTDETPLRVARCWPL